MIFSHHNVSLAAFFDSEKQIRGSPVASLVSVIKIRTKVAYTHACRLAWKLHETLPPQFYNLLVARPGEGVGILACLSLQNAFRLKKFSLIFTILNLFFILINYKINFTGFLKVEKTQGITNNC